MRTNLLTYIGIAILLGIAAVPYETGKSFRSDYTALLNRSQTPNLSIEIKSYKEGLFRSYVKLHVTVQVQNKIQEFDFNQTITHGPFVHDPSDGQWKKLYAYVQTYTQAPDSNIFVMANAQEPNWILMNASIDNKGHVLGNFSLPDITAPVTWSGLQGNFDTIVKGDALGDIHISANTDLLSGKIRTNTITLNQTSLDSVIQETNGLPHAIQYTLNSNDGSLINSNGDAFIFSKPNITGSLALDNQTFSKLNLNLDLPSLSASEINGEKVSIQLKNIKLKLNDNLNSPAKFDGDYQISADALNSTIDTEQIGIQKFAFSGKLTGSSLSDCTTSNALSIAKVSLTEESGNLILSGIKDVINYNENNQTNSKVDNSLSLDSINVTGSDAQSSFVLNNFNLQNAFAYLDDGSSVDNSSISFPSAKLTLNQTQNYSVENLQTSATRTKSKDDQVNIDSKLHLGKLTLLNDNIGPWDSNFNVSHLKETYPTHTHSISEFINDSMTNPDSVTKIQISLLPETSIKTNISIQSPFGNLNMDSAGNFNADGPIVLDMKDPNLKKELIEKTLFHFHLEANIAMVNHYIDMIGNMTDPDHHSNTTGMMKHFIVTWTNNGYLSLVQPNFINDMSLANGIFTVNGIQVFNANPPPPAPPQGATTPLGTPTVTPGGPIQTGNQAAAKVNNIRNPSSNTPTGN